MNNITIYSTPNCPWCHKAKEYFKSKNLAYTEYDVSTDIPHQQEMIAKSGQFGVPVIDINSKVIVGFDLPKINEALVMDDAKSAN